jgi:alpha-tubulin suppressor-like RCC1 family protein
MGATAVFAGGNQSCAEVGGALRCWGGNTSGQLGFNNKASTNTATAVTVLGDAGAPLSMTLGGSHTCIVRSDGVVLCWGAGSYGQLGDNTGTDQTLPVIAQTSGMALSVAAGANHTCAVLTNHNVECWGYGALGELGNGSTTSSNKPVPVSGITTAVAVRSEGETTCALLTDGSVRCWGASPDGQLGDGAVVLLATPSFVVGL